MKENQEKTGTKSDKIFVRIEHDTNLKLTKLGHMNEIQSVIIKKLVDHAHVCDKWWLERDEDEL